MHSCQFLGPFFLAFFYYTTWEIPICHENITQFIRKTSNRVKVKITRQGQGSLDSGKSKGGLSNGGLRPLSAICAQSSTIVHFCGLFGSLSKGGLSSQNDENRRQSWTIVDECLKPPFGKPPFRLSRLTVMSRSSHRNRVIFPN